MILGMSTFTLVHTMLSLVALLAGLIVVFGMLGTRTLPQWTGLFIVTAVATSVTGLRISVREIRGFPLDRRHFAGRARDRDPGALRVSPRRRLALDLRRDNRRSAAYFLVFVAIAQAFKKSTGAARDGADLVGAAVRDVARLVVLVIFRCAHRCGGEQVPSRAARLLDAPSTSTDVARPWRCARAADVRMRGHPVHQDVFARAT